MAEYKVLKRFRDKLTSKVYFSGDIFETDDQDRAASAIKRGLIETKSKQSPSLDQDVSQYHVGGGYYELPDGNRVRGKDKAEEALKAGE